MEPRRESEAIMNELLGPDPVQLAFPRQSLGDALAHPFRATFTRTCSEAASLAVA